MASNWIPFDEVIRRVLNNDSDEDFDGNMSDESESELSDHPVSENSESSFENNENSSESEVSNAEIGMFTLFL